MAVEFLRPGSFGGYKVQTTREESMEWTHVAMPRAEYYGLLDEIAQANQDADNAALDAGDKIRQNTAAANAAIQRVKENAAVRVKELEAALADAQKEIEYQQGLNKTMIWMAKKRANADRDIRPKTERSGFIVLRCKTKTIKYRKGKGWEYVRLRETTIQTPFAADFTEEQAQTEAKKLYQAYDPNSDEWLISRIGITGNYDGMYEDMIKDPQWVAYMPEHNIATETNWVQNFQTGFWEMIIEHTKALGPVPEDLRPEPKGKKKDQGKGPKKMKQPKNNKVIPKITDDEEV